MTDKQEFIDNIDGNTLSKALKKILNVLENQSDLLNENNIDQARIATAYFSPSGFGNIAKAMSRIPSIKLLLGSDPIADNARWQRKLEESEDTFYQKKLKEKLKDQEQLLRLERDQIPFNKDSSKAIKQLINVLTSGNMEVRRYEKNFLHAKAYIFSKNPDKEKKCDDVIIAGSSNLTSAGLNSNLELNLGRYDDSTVSKGKEWFDTLWNDARPFDLASFFEELFQIKTPFEIFLRVLWELYGEEIDKDFIAEDGLPLTSFQQHGVARALRLIEQTGGVIVADEVGLGKTFIAGEILNIYKQRRQRALLVCPAALRDTAWKQFQSDFDIRLETLSFEELARDKQLKDEKRRPNANSINLECDIEEYQLVIIDEAHNYRNPDSPTRADALRTFLYGRRKDVLMLTATPVNNSLWDLYHLTRFFLKQDTFLANKGILSIKDRFDQAMRTNPNSLSPDILYPIIDATTVKRTRQFIQKYYRNDQVKIEGVYQPIVFPQPKAISIRYDINQLAPGLFDLIELYFDPDEPECLVFARYKANSYLKVPDPEDERIGNAATGLILSGLLKRFESSAGAFKISIQRLIDQHKIFLEGLKNGKVVSTEFLREAAANDDEDFDDLLQSSDATYPAELFNIDALEADIENDLSKLNKIFSKLREIKIDNDPKLRVLIDNLEKIVEEAENEASDRNDFFDKRKVLIFSFFSDTVIWIKEFLIKEIKTNSKLSHYKDRLEILTGNIQNDQDSKANVASRFAPKTAGRPGDEDKTDILITTDVLAEGVNLQQARHIINYDMPWNPMKLVQRHGRIDRIGSQHNRIFMRTIFPANRLDALLGLEERISRKIAMASASVGIVSPIENVQTSNRDFTETKEEIERLLAEDPSLYERGGTDASVQSGEEYRQTLRSAIQTRRENIIEMSWKSGSGIRKGNEQGVFFCAKVGERTYLRFIHTNEEWKPKYINIESETISNVSKKPLIDTEIGRCLRLIECDEESETIITDLIIEEAYDLWYIVQKNIYDSWMFETDPINLQPKIRPLNLQVSDFIRTNKPSNISQVQIELALDIVESPWSRRDERKLRYWFQIEENDTKKSEHLVKNILASGLEPFISPEPLPIITESDVKLLTWMSISV